MKNKFLIIFLLIIAFGINHVYPQGGFTEYENDDNLLITYNWQRASPFNKDSDAVLSTRVTNKNEHTVNWTFAIGLYKHGILVYESESNQLCLKPGQSRRGGLAGLRFTAEGIKLSDIEDPAITWEYTVFDVQETESCN